MRTLLILMLSVWIGTAWALEPDPMDPEPDGDPQHVPEEEMTEGDRAQAGYMLFEREEYDEAFEYLEPLAEAGHAKPQFYMGFMHAKGLHVEQDSEAAVRWYEMAAEQGDAPAQYNLGVMYAYGEGIEMDEERGAEWIRKAAEAGYDRAQYSLGLLYTDGIGVEQDDARAMRWFRSAADKGFRQAFYSVALNYLNGDGVEQDDAEGFRWAERAAERHVPDGQALLGALYASGRGVAKDEAEAAEWYAEAARNGSRIGAERLAAYVDEYGREVTADSVTYRKEPDANADSVGAGSAGDRVAVLEEDGDWARIYLGDIEDFAWVRTEALAPAE